MGGGGNSGNSGNETVEVDTMKPVITGSRDPLPNSFGWNNTDVTVSFSCVDTDPVKSAFKKNTVKGKTLTKEGKDQSVTNTGECIDAAGNVADSVTVSNINIDKTPPKVTITLPGTGEYVLNQSITATWSATDALSGVVSPTSGSVSIDTSSVGTKTFTLPAGTAMDKAGNSSLKVTKSYSVIADTEDPVIVDPEDPDTVYPQTWATGSGTASNPWANDCIQKAYDAVPAGGTIYLSAGYYQLAGTLTVTKTINIVGDGKGKTFIITVDACAITIRKTDNCTLKGFTVDASAQTGGINIPGIFLKTSDYLKLEDIEIINGGQSGLSSENCNYGYYINIYTHGSFEDGIHPGSNIIGNNIHNTYQNIYSWDNGNNGFDDMGYQSDNDTTVYNNVYDNLQCWDNRTKGIAFEYLRGCVLSNSSTSGNDDHGIYMHHNEDINIHDCFVTLSGNDGLDIEFSDNMSFVNVVSKNNNGSGGAYINNGSAISFLSCHLYDDRNTPIQKYGLVNGDTSTTDYIELTDCILMPNKIAAIYDESGTVVIVITEKMLAKF